MRQISMFDGIQPLKITKPIRLIELFAGIGAQAKALERFELLFEHYRVCEIDPYAVESYNAIHGTNFNPTDITQLRGVDLGVTDTNLYTYILTYSFPCQDLSLCGEQKGMAEQSGTRSALLWEVRRILQECEELPQILVMENVPQVIGQNNKAEFMKWVKFLNALGYKSKYQIMNAVEYGVPQNRERCFMVSWLGDYYYEFPEPRPLQKVLRDLLLPETEIEDKYYLSERAIKYVLRREGKYTQLLSEKSPIEQWAITAKGNANWTGNFIVSEPQLVGGYGEKKSNGGTQWYQQDRVYSADATAMALCAEMTCGSYAYYVGADGVNAMSADGVARAVRASGRGSNERHSWDLVDLRVYDAYNGNQIDKDICGTITTGVAYFGSGTFCISRDKSHIRRLTPLECWRLMDFDDEDFYKARKALNEKFYKGKDKSSSQLYKQAGNSIVVNCLYEIFKKML